MFENIQALVVLAMFVVAAVFIVRWVLFATGRFGLPKVDASPDSPRAFGYKMTWLAVRSDDAERVCRVLERVDERFAGREFRRCNWSSGLARIFANFRNPEVFVTPPVDGWVLLANWRPAEEDSLDDFRSVLEPLSDEFGLAGAFGSHRVVSATMWALADHGTLRRCFAEADGETYLDYGAETPEEEQLDVLSAAEIHERLESIDDPHQEDALFQKMADEVTVLELAGMWSIDPSALEDRQAKGTGFIVRPDRA